jgi:hypothetical protein
MSNAFHYQNTFDDALAQEFRSILGVSSLNLLNPHDFWDFTDEDALTLQGTAVKAIANKGSSDDAITHSTGNTITFDGTKCIGHQYANSYKAGAAGDRNFLHDGTGAEVFIIHKQAAATNEQYFYLSNDVSGSSYQPITTGTLAWNEATPNGIHYDMPSLQQMGIELADEINAANS